MEFDKAIYETPNMCKVCGGRCCKHHPCDFHPNDLFKDGNVNEDRLREIINTGLVQIDWWDGDTSSEDLYDRIYMIRPRVGQSLAGYYYLFHPMWHGKCIFLSDTGCMLSFDQRPMGGKSLVCDAPGIVNEELSTFGKRDAAIEWRKHQDILSKIAKEMRYNELPLLTADDIKRGIEILFPQ